MSANQLHVIALISGGKDSFFNLLHCIQQGHCIVALANLFPAQDGDSNAEVQVILPDQPTSRHSDQGNNEIKTDLNSFMYQTVGHEVIPLYAAATGLPLYRQPIVGGATRHERDYDQSAVAQGTIEETESMLSLLETIKERHPEANAVCAGAILSTYQRTRVESVALRLGLTPLAYLWKYPVLPPDSQWKHPAPLPASTSADEAQLLLDMAASGLDARIIKVASAGLAEDNLWARVTSSSGVDQVKNALRKFGAAEGAVLGEGGEFETVVVDGPSWLFGRRVDVPEGGRTVVKEGGGTCWLSLRGASLQDKLKGEKKMEDIRVPGLLDLKFQWLSDELSSKKGSAEAEPQLSRPSRLILKACRRLAVREHMQSFVADPRECGDSIESQTEHVCQEISKTLASWSLDASQITNTVIILRNMADFPKVNGRYGKLFTRPNPPSRVTISCGDLLPTGCNIAIHISAPSNPVMSQRDGLHVQSRSYWAPANIGPYSQAISVRTVADRSTSLTSTLIAGQIPLIPATMLLPPPTDQEREKQIILSLQHLWRIGVELGVQYWSSAVAYIAPSGKYTSESDMQSTARLAGRAWELAHTQPDQEEDPEDDVDPWDLKYNSQYSTVAGADQAKKRPLPHWDVLSLQQQNDRTSRQPPFFAAEVEELPRQSMVEWHAHVGFSGIDDGQVEFLHAWNLGGVGRKSCHMVIKSSDVCFVHTVLSLEIMGSGLEDTSLRHSLSKARLESLESVGLSESEQGADGPYLVYVDSRSVDASAFSTGQAGPPSVAIVPCRSLWNQWGKRVACVALYKTVLGSETEEVE